MQLADLTINREYFRAAEAEVVVVGGGSQAVHGDAHAGSPNQCAAEPRLNQVIVFKRNGKCHRGGVLESTKQGPDQHGVQGASKAPCLCQRLLADEMSRNGAGVRGAAMFPEVDPLPGAQSKVALADGDGKVDRRQRGADMGGHVVVALDRVREKGIAVRHEARKEVLQITPHVRVGIFLDKQRGRSMAEVQSDQAARRTVLQQPSPPLWR